VQPHRSYIRARLMNYFGEVIVLTKKPEGKEEV